MTKRSLVMRFEVVEEGDQLPTDELAMLAQAFAEGLSVTTHEAFHPYSDELLGTIMLGEVLEVAIEEEESAP